MAGMLKLDTLGGGVPPTDSTWDSGGLSTRGEPLIKDIGIAENVLVPNFYSENTPFLAKDFE